MTDLAKLLEVLRIVDELDTYIKVLHADNKLNTQNASELINYCKKANEVL